MIVSHSMVNGRPLKLPKIASKKHEYMLNNKSTSSKQTAVIFPHIINTQSTLIIREI